MDSQKKGKVRFDLLQVKKIAGYPAIPDIRFPAIGLAGYPAKSVPVSGASLAIRIAFRHVIYKKVKKN